MEKMSDKRRKSKKANKKIANLSKSLGKTPFRVLTAPAGFSFKSKLDHNRKNNKKSVNEGLRDVT